MNAERGEPAVQAEVANFLGDPRTYGGRAGEVKRIDTHAAMVFLAGDDVYKVKRAVRFPFLDFSTLEKRRRACEREVELNRATAPDIYIGVVPITRAADGGLSFTGRGPTVEWAVHMRRFDETATLDRLCASGRIDAALIDALAAQVAGLHRGAAVAKATDIAGRMARIASQNIGELRDRSDLFAPDRVDRLAAATDAALRRVAPLMRRRAAAGQVRRCHGDLHLANIALIDGRPVIFDALEFDEELATIDILYDLAFLLMDLWSRGESTHANRLLNRWLAARQMVAVDMDGLALLPLFISMRAAIRAKVAAARLRHLDGTDRATAEGEARSMFALACGAMSPPPARLVAIGGLSGTGKTTLAMAIAPDIGPIPGAVVVRSDVLRKVLAEVGETDRLPPDRYTPEASVAVYAAMGDLAGRALAAGHGAILDAVHARPAEREAACRVAARAGAAFTGLWLEAPAAELIDRVSARRGDASDADRSVVESQLGYDVGSIGWTRIEAGSDFAATAVRARAALALASPPSPPRTMTGHATERGER